MYSRTVRKIELLSPAGNLETGIEAINHGADAVYIGAPRFSARAAAGNSLYDIRRLVEYAHQYRAKVYVALNTILYDSELPEAEEIIRECYDIGVDALIIQDMGILKLDIPPIPLHASTQCDNRDIDKIRFFEKLGFAQVVLARELSLEDIKTIAKRTNLSLEVFVHGALCVSCSGQCYISQSVTGRSANRGECAQFCRLPYTLQDATGKTLARYKHLLSPKDLNQSGNLEKLLDAGVSSLKIEGRLKETSYVKNITAYYRQKLDAIFEKRPEYARASSGTTTPFFVPDPAKSFNRGFTSYFLHGRKEPVVSPDTPKSTGEPIGNIKDLNRNFFTATGQKTIHNGDGLCFFNERKELQGFRVNKVTDGKIFPAEMPSLSIGTTLYRNFDREFEKTLAQKSAERKINIDFVLEEDEFGFSLTATDEDGCQTNIRHAFPKEISPKNQKENQEQQLSKLGNTPFQLDKLTITFSMNWFIPSSVLSNMRRRAVEGLLAERKNNYLRPERKIPPISPVYPEKNLSYLANVANRKALTFYKQSGVETIEPAFETEAKTNVPVMFTKHCILHQMGCCKKETNVKNDLVEPLFLFSGKNRFQLKFDCGRCEMQVINIAHYR
ncbi:collagenase [Bacteroidia bacterium]|nr:collagenase [Bacteroidia bacterium]